MRHTQGCTHTAGLLLSFSINKDNLEWWQPLRAYFHCPRGSIQISIAAGWWEVMRLWSQKSKLSKFFLSVCQNIILFYPSMKHKIAVCKNIISINRKVYKSIVLSVLFLPFFELLPCECSISFPWKQLWDLTSSLLERDNTCTKWHQIFHRFLLNRTAICKRLGFVWQQYLSICG